MNRFWKFIITVIFLFGLFPDPFLGWFDEIICLILLAMILLFGVKKDVTDKY